TTCTVSGFADCQTGAAQSIDAGMKSPVFTITADPSNWSLEGEIRYVIHDPELVVGSEVIVTLQEGATVLEQCVAEINPAPTGQVQYDAQVVALDNNSCQINLIRTLAPEPNSPTMQLVIHNQVGRSIDTRSYTYGLIENKVEVQYGTFNSAFSDIPVAETHTSILSGLDGVGSRYQSMVYYTFDDYRMSSVPTGLQILLNNTQSDDSKEWCKAAITGWNGGYRLYQASTEVIGEPANSTCIITITSQDNPSTPVNYGFKAMSNLPTEGNRQWEYFTINNEHYLAAANSRAQNISYIKQNMFRLDKSRDEFVGLSNLVVGYRCVDASYKDQFKDHAYSWQYFQVDGRPRIIMANHYSYPYRQGYEEQCDTGGKDYWTSSYIYDWKDGQFDIGESCCESLMTDSALMWEFYTNRGQSYLAVAELGMTGKSGLSVYQWQSGKFVKTTQTQLPTSSTQYVEAFTVADQTYVVRSPGGENQDAEIYSIAADGQWVLHQNKNSTPGYALAPTGFVTQSRVFSVGSETFLWLGFDPNRSTGDSWIYHWKYIPELQKSLFVHYQSLPENFKNAQAFSPFMAGKNLLIAVSFGNQGVVAYHWNSILQQMEVQAAYSVWSAGSAVSGLTAFSVGDVPYLALAVYQDQNNQVQTGSPVLRWQISQ
ncbi:MAG: hypothetical protein ACHP9Y_04765, partial [Gammaproteobacteria bacterium]